VKFIDQVPNVGTIVHTASNGPATSAWTSTALADVSAGATYKPDGTAWDATDFQPNDTILFGTTWYDAGGGGNNSWACITSIWGEIDYIPPAGGYVFLLGLAGLSALPFVGRLTSFSAFRKFLEWRHIFHPRHTRWDARNVDELQLAWDEVRNYRWPSFYQIGGADVAYQ
jgi:hypothetical protein